VAALEGLLSPHLTLTKYHWLNEIDESRLAAGVVARKLSILSYGLDFEHIQSLTESPASRDVARSAEIRAKHQIGWQSRSQPRLLGRIPELEAIQSYYIVLRLF
jgi:hypothetical protein